MPKINVTMTRSEVILLPRKWVKVAVSMERFSSERIFFSVCIHLKSTVSQEKLKENRNMSSGWDNLTMTKSRLADRGFLLAEHCCSGVPTTVEGIKSQLNPSIFLLNRASVCYVLFQLVFSH